MKTQVLIIITAMLLVSPLPLYAGTKSKAVREIIEMAGKVKWPKFFKNSTYNPLPFSKIDEVVEGVDTKNFLEAIDQLSPGHADRYISQYNDALTNFKNQIGHLQREHADLLGDLDKLKNKGFLGFCTADPQDMKKAERAIGGIKEAISEAAKNLENTIEQIGKQANRLAFHKNEASKITDPATARELAEKAQSTYDRIRDMGREGIPLSQVAIDRANDALQQVRAYEEQAEALVRVDAIEFINKHWAGKGPGDRISIPTIEGEGWSQLFNKL